MAMTVLIYLLEFVAAMTLWFALGATLWGYALVIGILVLLAPFNAWIGEHTEMPPPSTWEDGGSGSSQH